MTGEDRCEACGEPMDAHEKAMGWPIHAVSGEHVNDDDVPAGSPASVDDLQLIGPCCYGDEAFCACGALLPGSTDVAACEACGAQDKADGITIEEED